MAYFDAEAEIREATTRRRRREHQQKWRWVAPTVGGAIAAALFVLLVIWVYSLVNSTGSSPTVTELSE